MRHVLFIAIFVVFHALIKGSGGKIRSSGDPFADSLPTESLHLFQNEWIMNQLCIASDKKKSKCETESHRLECPHISENWRLPRT
jgi:hypothetical protein